MSEVIETEDFVAEATEWIARRIVEGQQGGGTFRLSLCGGSTPKPIYEALGRRTDIDWRRVLITFGDERCVLPNHADSNYRMAKESLLDAAGVPEENVIRLEGEREPDVAAAVCEHRLREIATEAGEEIFRHDLILLGMGDDGHTASLFPDSLALAEDRRWVVVNYVVKLDSWRLTFTFPLINAAKTVAFLVNGDAKRPVVSRVLAGGSEFPAEKIEPGELFWLLG